MGSSEDHFVMKGRQSTYNGRLPQSVSRTALDVERTKMKLLGLSISGRTRVFLFARHARAKLRCQRLTAWIAMGLLGLAEVCATGLRDGDIIAICGDSITEQRMYSVFMEDYLVLSQPRADLSVFQFGWSGEAAPGFGSRVESDVLPFKPTVVTTFYGMNDGGYRPADAKTNLAYREATSSYIRKLSAAGVRAILVGSPGVVDTDSFRAWFLARCSPDEYNETLNQLGTAAQATARDAGAEFVDVHAPMLDTMGKMKAQYGPGYVIAKDGVHPAYDGQLVIAFAFLEALGCDGDIGQISLDATSGLATVSAGHRLVESSRTVIHVESDRYPFCFIDDSGAVAFPGNFLKQFCFNERLNRFLLIVTGLPTARASVKWGSENKEFSAEELRRGINLGAEFPKNPFVGHFARVDAAVREKQEYETAASKVLLHGLPEWQKNFPEMADVFTALQRAVIVRAKALDKAAKALRVPVRHSIEVLPVRDDKNSN